ncbi:MAG: hypothetical protein R3D29_05980 [Nitratireductor sp.]
MTSNVRPTVMYPDSYRSRVSALAVITSAAFFGANAFIGLSMGSTG